MNNSTFNKIRSELENKKYPVKRVNMGDIVHRGENVYSIGNREYVFENYVQSELDKYLGISTQEEYTLLESGGERELTNLRNWLLSRNAGKNLLVMASDKGSVIKIEKCKGDIIPPSTFFDIVEKFCDSNNHNVIEVKYNEFNPFQISAVLDKDNPKIVSIADGEDFNVGQLSFAWNLSSVDLQEEYTRLICSNGATSIERRSIKSIYNASNESIRKMIFLDSKEKELIEDRTNRYLEKSKEAIHTYASIGEVAHVSRILKGNGIDNAKADELSGFRDILDRLGDQQKKYLTYDNKKRIRSNQTIWELYNLLTYITSHQVEDYKIINPQQMMQDSSAFLGSERDIKDYIDIDDVA